MVAIWENCFKKWECINEQKSNGTSKNQKEARKDPRHKVPYVDSDAGQAKWGGWNKTGRQRVAALGKLIGEARKKDTTAKYEAACLERVREKNDTEAKEKSKAAKKKKRKADTMEEVEDEFDVLW